MTHLAARSVQAWRQQIETFKTPLEELDREALLAIKAAEADERVGNWIAEKAGPLWRHFGLFAFRVFRRPDGRAERVEPRDGSWCLGFPVLGLTCEPIGRGLVREHYNVLDLIAIDPKGEPGAWSLAGEPVGVLGTPWPPASLEDPWRVRVVRTPLDWLRTLPSQEAFPDEVEPVCIVDPASSDARYLLVHASELIAEDDEHADELAAMVRRARKEALPPPARVSVLVKPGEARAA